MGSTPRDLILSAMGILTAAIIIWILYGVLKIVLPVLFLGALGYGVYKLGRRFL